MIILLEDDCAPDAVEYFNNKFTSIVKETVDVFKKDTNTIIIDEGDEISYTKDNYRLTLSYEDTRWKLEEQPFLK